jgi:hypothetical protein
MFLWKAQMHGEGLEVLDEAGDGAWIGALPLDAKDAHASACLGDCSPAGRLLNIVEDLPPEPAWESWRLHTLEARMELCHEETVPRSGIRMN